LAYRNSQSFVLMWLQSAGDVTISSLLYDLNKGLRTCQETSVDGHLKKNEIGSLKFNVNKEGIEKVDHKFVIKLFGSNMKIGFKKVLPM